VLGENAKQCCIDKKCMDSINGNNSSCDENGDKSCTDNKSRDNVANEILKNMNIDNLTKALSKSFKDSLKKILGGITSCLSRKSIPEDISQGILIYPTDKNKFNEISKILGINKEIRWTLDLLEPKAIQENTNGPCSSDWDNNDGQYPPN
jgi:hypothetical protein